MTLREAMRILRSYPNASVYVNCGILAIPVERHILIAQMSDLNDLSSDKKLGVSLSYDSDLHIIEVNPCA